MAQKEYGIELFQDGRLTATRAIAENQTLTLGRGATDLPVQGSALVAGHYATLICHNGELFLEIHSKNASFRGNERLTEGKKHLLRHNEEIKIAGSNHTLRITEKQVFIRNLPPIPGQNSPPEPARHSFQSATTSPEPASAGNPPSEQPRAIKMRRRIQLSFTNRQGEGITDPARFPEILNQKGKVSIGRDPANDIVLSSLLVSRRHALIEKAQNGIYLRVLANSGVFVNGQRVDQTIQISERDYFTIGQFRFSLSGKVEDILESNEPAIVASGIQKTYNNGFIGLQTTDIRIPSREFVALMGPSGCGKSTLLKCLNGDSPPSAGTVTIRGLPLNTENYNLIKRSIGYVPQDDIVHRELTVDQTMYYAAKLRLADDVSEAEAGERINKVLTDLNINDSKIRQNKIGELSGGQRKRISIAVELLNDPSILFLDEPTSPLDPETIDDFLNCLRKLTEDGTTVVMVTHKPDDLNYVGQVIFLSKGGYLTYFGKVDKMYGYFDLKNDNIIPIYSKLSDVAEGKRWHYKWTKSTGNGAAIARPAPQTLRKPRTESWARQYFWLSRRYFNIKWNDKGNILLLLGQPVIIAALISFIFESLQIGVLFLMAITAVWFGISNAAKELVSELPIYKRERMYNLGIWAYIASKVTVLSVIALAQVILFVGILFFAYSSGGEHGVRLYNYFATIGFLFYLSVSATLLGLLLSSFVANTERLMTLVPISIIPQVMLAGIVARLDTVFKEVISYVTLGRWGTEGLARIQDAGARKMDNYFVAGDGDKELAGVMSHVPEIRKDSILKKTVDIETPAGRKAQEVEVPADIPTGKTIEEPCGALDLLEMYDKEKNLAWFDSYQDNLLAITILNGIMLLVLFWMIRKKDSI